MSERRVDWSEVEHRLRRFLAFEDHRPGRAIPYYVTANGVRQAMPSRLRDDAWAVLTAILDAQRLATIDAARAVPAGLDVERLAIKAAARLEGEVSRLRTELAACTEAYAAKENDHE